MGSLGILIGVIIIAIYIWWDNEYNYVIKQNCTSQYMHTYVNKGICIGLWSRMDSLSNVTKELKIQRRNEAKEFIKKHKELEKL